MSAQEIFGGRDLSLIRVDELSDREVVTYYEQVKQSGLSDIEIEQVALSRGFPAGEYAKFKDRLNAIQGRQNKRSSNSGNNRRTGSQDSSRKNRAPMQDEKIFGSEIFNNSDLTFEPPQAIATPMNYELGPGDELQIQVYGVQITSQEVKLSPDGAITIPYVGVLRLNGLTVEAATARIKQAMSSTAYSTLKTGASKLSVTLGGVKSIRVTILGAMKPGTYTLSSLTTLFNALYVCGGPSKYGSYREIELIRNNKVLRKVDLYRFLLSADQADNLRLRDQDVIRIPVYKNRVEIEGEVKRPGIFEMLPGEKFSDLIGFAQGFTDSAYRAAVKVTQVTDKERKVQDIYAAQLTTYQPQPGDVYVVSKILNRYSNRVVITGAVFRPGAFELTPGLTIGELIRKADGLREDAYNVRGQVLRKKNDLTSEVVSFNVGEAYADSTGNRYLLRKDDSVFIRSIFDLRTDFKVSIQGEVRKPGTFPFVDSLSLKDLLFQAGGLTDAAYPQKIEIARLINRDTLTRQDTRLSEVLEFDNGSDLSLQSSDIILRPYDVVTIRRKPGYLALDSVRITGQVQYPGPYTLVNRSEKISNLIKRSGGLTPEAYPGGVYLKRMNNLNVNDEIKTQNVLKIQQQLKDSTGQLLSEIRRNYDLIPVDYPSILADSNSLENILLRPGDELVIPKFEGQVRVNGQVLFPTQVPFNVENNFADYISAAGGFTENAKRGKAYIVYANGKARATRHFLFFKSYPEVRPGAEIVVPKKIEKPRRSSTELIGMASALASLAGVVVALIQLSK